MNSIQRMMKVLVIIQARYQIYLNMHPVLYYLCNIIGAFHFWITVLYPNNEVVQYVAKWFDLSFPQHGFDIGWVMVLCSVLIYMVFLLLLRQVYVALTRTQREAAMQAGILERYLITIVGGLGIFVTTAFMLPTIRSCLQNIWMGPDVGLFYYMAWVTVVLYVGMVLPFHSVFLTDLSLLSGNIYSSLQFLNYMRLMPFIRITLCFALVIQEIAHPAFVYCILPLSLLSFYREPIWHYNKDRQIRTIFYMMTWILVIRFVASIYNAPVQGGIIIICSVVFPYFLKSITSARVQRLFMEVTITVTKIKILSAFMNDFTNKLKHLAMFYVTHRKECSDPECKCHTVNVSYLSRPEGIPDWYGMFNDLIKKHFNLKRITSMHISERAPLLSKVADLAFVQVDIVSQGLNKKNTALFMLTEIMGYVQGENWFAMHLNAYDMRFRMWMEEKMVYDTSQIDATNNYAKTYMEYQVHVLKLSYAIRESVSKHFTFWNQATIKQYDIQTVVNAISEAYDSHLKVQKALRNLLTHEDVQAIVFPIYEEYFRKVCNVTLPRPNKRVSTVEKISVDMKNYSYEAKTGTCFVKINSDSNFDSIVNNNKFFEQFLGFFNNVDGALKVSMLIPDPFRQFHTKKQKAFIASGGYLLQNVRVLIKKQSGRILDVTMTIQIVPSLKEGLVASVFFFPRFSLQIDNIFLCGSAGNVIAYSTTFQQEVLHYYDQIELDELGRIFTWKVLNVLKECGGEKGLKPDWEVSFDLGDKSWKVTLRRQFYDNIKNLTFYVLKLTEIKTSEQPRMVIVDPIKKFDSFRHSDFLTNDDKEKFESSIAQQDFWKNGIIKKSREERIQDIFSLMQQWKKSRSIQIWTVCTVFLITSIIIVTIFSVRFVGEKVKMARSFDQIRLAYHNVNSRLSDALYYMRWANIEASTSKSPDRFAYYLSRFKQNQYEAAQAYSTLSNKLVFSEEAYHVEDSGEVISEQMSFFLSLERFVFGSSTNLIRTGIEDFGFSFLRTEISKPYNTFEKNFVAANLNGLLVTLPAFQRATNQTLASHNCKLGKCIQNQKILSIKISSSILIAILMVVSFCMALMIKILRDKVFELMELLPQSEMLLRKNMVSSYKEKYFPDKTDEIQKDEKVQKISAQKFYLNFEKAIAPAEISSVAFIKEDAKDKQSLIIPRFSRNYPGQKQRSPSGFCRTLNQTQEISGRNLFKKKWGNDKQVGKNDRVIDPNGLMNTEQNFIAKKAKIFRPLHFERSKSQLLFVLHLLLFSPLVAFFMIIISVHISATQRFIWHFRNSDLIHDQIRLTKQVKLYTLELGFQDGAISPTQSTSVPKSLVERLDHAYAVERSLIDTLTGGDRTSKQMHAFNQRDICGSLHRLQLFKTQEVSFTQEECRNLRGSIDFTFGRRAALVRFLEEARMLEIRYGDCSNCTRQQREEFVNNQTLKGMSAQDHYFEAISRYLLKLYNEDLDTAISSFENTVYYLTGLAVALSLAILAILSKIVKKSLLHDITAIKAIFHLVSKKNIQEDQEMKITVLEKMSFSIIE